MLNTLIDQYTTGEDFNLPKDYEMSSACTLKETPYIFNGESCTLVVEVNGIYYNGRKRKNIIEYPQVITINVYDQFQCGTDFETICKLSNEVYSFLD